VTATANLGVESEMAIFGTIVFAIGVVALCAAIGPIERLEDETKRLSVKLKVMRVPGI